MAVTAAQLKILFTHNLAQVQAEMGAFGAMLGKTGPVGIAAGVAIAAVAAVGVVATKMAGDFQAGMTSLVTGAGEAQSNLKLVSDGILKMAVDTGTTTKQLTDGMYMIESAGYHGQAGLDILKASAEGAKVGAADLGSVANAVTTVMKDYQDQHISAAQATNTLIATVSQGKTHMEDLAGAVSHILPASSAAHVGLTDIMGAMATLTGEGIDAANASTYLRQMIIALNAPSSTAKKALEDIGLTTDQVSATMQKSLPAAVQLIQQHLVATYGSSGPKYVGAIKDISGGLREMQGMLALTGGHLTDFQANVQTIAQHVQQGGSQIGGWNQVQGTFNQNMDRAKEVVQTLMIELGQKFLPVATQLVTFIADHAIPAISNFISFITGTSKQAEILRPILAAVAIAIAGALVAAFLAWAVSAAAAAVATIAATWPVLAIGAAIALLIAGVVLLVTHWGVISKAFADSGFGKVVLGIIHDITSRIGDLLGVLGKVKDAIGNAFGGVGKALGHIPGFASGGTLPEGWALVGEQGPELISAPGAQVYPISGGVPLSGGGAGGGMPITINITTQLDGRTVARNTVRHMPGVLRQAIGTRAF